MKIVLTGATGLAGSEVLRQAVVDPDIEKITLLTRRPTGSTHTKIKEIVIKDFCDYSKVSADLIGQDAGIWCLGVSQSDVSRHEYVKVTFDYALAFAKAFFGSNPDARFCFLSGQGADQTERTLTLFGKIKGRAERELVILSKNTFNFRPGYIEPSVPREQTKPFHRFLNSVAPLVNKVTDNFSVTSQQLARCLIDVAKVGAESSILDNKSIRRWN